MRKKLVQALSVALMLSLLMTLCGGIFSAAQAEDRPTLKLLLSFWSVDLNNNFMKQLIEEKTGYNLEIEVLPDGKDAELEKLNLLMSTGSEYDMIRLFNEDNFKMLARNNYLTDLTELIPNYPNIESSQDDWWKMCTIDGKIYGIPIQKNAEGAVHGTLYRADIFAELGLEIPKNAEEFTEVLRAIKAAKPDMIPYCISSSPIVDTVTSAFGFAWATPWNVVDGELVNNVKMPGFVDYVKYMRSLYQEGLIDNEFASNKVENVQQKLASDRVAISEFGWWYWQCLQSVRDNVPGVEVGYLPALESADGSKYYSAGTGPDAVTFIPKSSKQPEAVLDFLNKFLDPAIYDEMMNGVEGVDYIDNGDGTYELKDTFSNWVEAWWWQFGERIELNPKTFILGITGEGPDVYKTYQDQNEAVKDAYVFDPRLFMDSSTINAKYAATLDQLTNEFFIKMVTGTDDIDAEYTKFLAVWESEGGTEVEEDLNALYKAAQ